MRLAAAAAERGNPNAATDAGVAGLLARAAAEGARLVALPEYFALISGDEADKVAIREQEGDGPIQHFMAAAHR